MTDVFIALFSLLALVFALLVVTLRQPMRAALALIAHMISLAGIYASLGVHVIALFQVLIYVGAVMVFMVYTIMLLDDRDTSYRRLYSRLALPGLLFVAIVAGELWMLLGHSVPVLPTTGVADSTQFQFASFSVAFMKQYWFHFELATVLLLIGIVAAWTAIKERR